MAVDVVEVEVVYAERNRCITLRLCALPDESVADIIRRCGILKLGLRFDPLQGEGSLGIFGERVTPHTRLRDGDRIEIYRPLECGPMEARRRRSVAVHT